MVQHGHPSRERRQRARRAPAHRHLHQRADRPGLATNCVDPRPACRARRGICVCASEPQVTVMLSLRSRPMNRLALFSLALAAALPRGATAQNALDSGDGRSPRFLLAMAAHSAPVPVDLKRSALLRQHISLAFDGVTLKEALAEISRQARLGLVYADDDIPVSMTVSLRADRITVAAALTDVLLDAGVDVVFSPDGRATLVKRPAGPALQFGSIAGTVTAVETGTPLTRAVVSVIGTHLSTETDANGRYTIATVPVGAQRLRARMLGYAPVDTGTTVAEGQESVVNFQLKAQAIELEAFVAVGYGEKRREDLTGAVTTVGPGAGSGRLRSESPGCFIGQCGREQCGEYSSGFDRRGPRQTRSADPRGHRIDHGAEGCRGVDLWRAGGRRSAARHDQTRYALDARLHVQQQHRRNQVNGNDGYA